MPKKKTTKKKSVKKAPTKEKLNKTLYTWTTQDNANWVKTNAVKNNISYSRFVNNILTYFKDNKISL